MLLLDDDEYKASQNAPHTAIHPAAWDGEPAEDELLRDGGELRGWLEGLQGAETVAGYVAANPWPAEGAGAGGSAPPPAAALGRSPFAAAPAPAPAPAVAPEDGPVFMLSAGGGGRDALAAGVTVDESSSVADQLAFLMSPGGN